MKMCKNHRNKFLLSRTIVEKYLISDKRHFLRFLKGWSSQGNWGFSWNIFIKCGRKNVTNRGWNLEGVPIIKIWRSIFRKQNSGFPLWKRQKLILFKICLFFLIYRDSNLWDFVSRSLYFLCFWTSKNWINLNDDSSNFGEFWIQSVFLENIRNLWILLLETLFSKT